MQRLFVAAGLAAAVLVLPPPAAAQNAQVSGFGGFTFGDVAASSAFGGTIAIPLSDNIQIVGEGGRMANVLPSIVALLSLEMGIAVIVEAILSFVNLSISTDDPTWGGIIAEGRLSIHQAWWVLVFPLVTLFLTVLSFSQFGEGLKARFDPVLR